MGEEEVTPAESRRPRRTSSRLQSLRDSEGYHRFLDKALWPLLTTLGMLAIARIQHGVTTSAVDEKTDKVKTEVKAEVKAEAKATAKTEAKTETASVVGGVWSGLADPLNKLQTRVEACEARLIAVEKTQKAQSAIEVALAHDFVVEGHPAALRRIDAGLVKDVKANAAKNSKELEARRKKPVPALKPLPLLLPVAPASIRLTPAPDKNDHPTVAPVVPTAPQNLDAGLGKG